MLCALLLAMAPLAQADRVMDRHEGGAISALAGEWPQVRRAAVADDRNFDMIAQVAAETAQLLPSKRRDATPATKEPKVLRGASRAQGTTRSQKTRVVKGQHFTPSAQRSKYMNDAEQFAKANGCPVPVATMKVAVVGPESFETFAVTCGAGAPMSIRCDSDRCRAT